MNVDMDIKCYIGIHTNTECHKESYTKKKGICDVKLNEDEYESLFWRASVVAPAEKIDNLLCFHHEYMYLRIAPSASKSCCDPFTKHVKKKKKPNGRTPVTLSLAKAILHHCKVKVKPVDDKLCSRCYGEVQKLPAVKEATIEQKSESESDMDVDYENFDDDDFLNTDQECHALVRHEKVNTSLELNDTSPFTVHSIPQHRRADLCKQKLSKVVKNLGSTLADIANVPHAAVLPEKDSISKEEIIRLRKAETDLNDLMGELKEKFQNSSSYDQKVQILTMKPNSWKPDQTKAYFGSSCTDHMLRRAREVKAEKGILGIHRRVRKEGISEDTKAKVLAIYEDDEYSRQMPGTSDKVSIAKKVYKTKRLLLCTVPELYATFQGLYPDNKIGLTRFYQLRPKWVVTPGASGTHKVCVCVHHENAKLIAVACLNSSYKDLVNLVVCDSTDKMCMVHRCENCPGTSALVDHLKSRFEDDADCDDDEEVNWQMPVDFQQWESTDRAGIETYTLPLIEFIEYAAEKLSDFCEHSYLSKCQAASLKQLLDNLPSDKVVAQLDFAENFQYVIQDEIQSYHWTKEYCTVHPAVLHMKKDGTVVTVSLCFISDDLSHDTSFVWALQRKLADYVHQNFSHVKTIEYFSDGCAGQYKNFKNFLNLTYHFNDFDILGIWNFFASCHGKSNCDGVGAAVKRKLRNKSLTVGPKDAILTSYAAYSYCVEAMPSIVMYHIAKNDISSDRKMLEQRYATGNTVPGTRSFHFFCSDQIGTVCYKRTSSDEKYAGTHCFFLSAVKYTMDQLPPLSYVACHYDDHWWIGTIIEKCDGGGDIKVNFLHPFGPSKSFYWPAKQDHCWVPLDKVVYKLGSPSLSSSTARRYRFTEDDLKSVERLFQERY